MQIIKIYEDNQQQERLLNNEENQEDAQIFITLNFGFILELLQKLMILIQVTAFLSIISIIINFGQNDVFLISTLLFILSITLMGCTMYIQVQFFEAKINSIKMQNEVKMNKWVYQSTPYFLFQYTSQAKFNMIRLTYLYCAIPIFYMGYHIILHRHDEKYINTDSWRGTDNYSHLVKNGNDEKFQEKLMLQNFLLISLGILCLILSLTFIVYEILSLSQKIYLRWTLGFWPSYQHDINTISINSVINQTKVFYLIYLYNFIVKKYIFCYALIFEPTTYQLFLIVQYCIQIFALDFLLTINFGLFVWDYQVDNSLQYVDYQLYIDSILRQKTWLNFIFKLLLVIFMILTIIGLFLFLNQRKKSYEIINFDLIVYYECGITQLVYLVRLIKGYIVIPYLKDRNRRQYNEVPQEVQMENLEHQNSRNDIPMSNKMKKNVIFNVKLKEKMDCSICLLQLISNSQKNPIIQLKCHTSHIFHLSCIKDWLINTNQCPICRVKVS